MPAANRKWKKQEPLPWNISRYQRPADTLISVQWLWTPASRTMSNQITVKSPRQWYFCYAGLKTLTTPKTLSENCLQIVSKLQIIHLLSPFFKNTFVLFYFFWNFNYLLFIYFTLQYCIGEVFLSSLSQSIYRVFCIFKCPRSFTNN